MFVSCYCELHFLYLYLKLLISLLQEFISWLSSVSPEDSVLVCWDDEVTLSKLFCILVKLVIVFCEVIVSNAQADEDLENVVPHF